MKTSLIFTLVLLAVCFTSCKKETDKLSESEGTIQLGVSLPQQQSKLKSVSVNETPAAIMISITDSKGKTVIESKKVNLFNMNGSYLSEPLSFMRGNYYITKFIVLNSSDSAIYATPLKGSQFEYLVNNPLPFLFNVNKDSVSQVNSEVISAKNAKFEDFGYDSFGFDIVKTFDFLTSVMIYNDSIKNWELTSATISIKDSLGRIAYNGALNAKTNQITLRDNSIFFSLSISKEGFQTSSYSILSTDLKTNYRNQVLIIKLFPYDTTIVRDIDGNVYHTVKIGNQTWMVENLKVTRYNDGTPIPNLTDTVAWATLKGPGYCWYNNDKSNKDSYGALYNWLVVKNSKLCPAGWHVPTIDELTYFTSLNYVGGDLKEVGEEHWKSPNTGATNSTGFTALPGGWVTMNGFKNMGIYGYWWSSTPFTTSNYAYSFSLSNTSKLNVVAGNQMQIGLSVRCIKNK